MSLLYANSDFCAVSYEVANEAAFSYLLIPIVSCGIETPAIYWHKDLNGSPTASFSRLAHITSIVIGNNRQGGQTRNSEYGINVHRSI